jgi:hypothetical protein
VTVCGALCATRTHNKCVSGLKISVVLDLGMLAAASTSFTYHTTVKYVELLRYTRSHILLAFRVQGFVWFLVTAQTPS